MNQPRIFHIAPLPPQERGLFAQRCPAGVAIDMVERADDPRWETMLCRADAVITGGHLLTAAELQRASRLKVVQMRGVGWQDRVPVDEMRARGIRLATCRQGTDQAVAEHALMLILALQRHLLAADASIRAGQFKHGNPALRRTSHKLAGSTIGLVGMGGTARALARVLGQFGVRGLYYSRTPRDEATSDAHQFQQVSLETLLSESDVVSLHLPGCQETRHFIGPREIAMMKPGAILVNTARGSIIDQAALTTALLSGHLGGAGLDVFDPEPLAKDDPILSHPNVIVTPHIASAQFDTFVEKIDFCMGNLARFLGGGSLESEIQL